MRFLLIALLAVSTLVTPAAASPAEVEGFPTRLPVSAVAGGDTDPVGTWPLRPDPQVVGAFDPPASPWGAGHRGVDLLGRPGQVVRSALPGTISYAGVLAGRGVVVVTHGATRTTYEPVTAAAGLSVGDPVGAGERLGVLEAAPSHCAPRSCLHWGWLEGATYLDPLRLVGLGPVRLLPFLGEGPVPSGATGPVATPPVPAWW